MRNPTPVLSLGLLVAISATSAGAAEAEPALERIPGAARGGSAVSAYAEGIYADYAGDSGPEVKIEVQTTASGELKSLAGHSLQGIVGLPTYHVEANDEAVTLSGTRFEPLDMGRVNLSDFALTVDAFNTVGLPIEAGAYRLLHVVVSIGGIVREHEAVEFCWPAQGHCVVFDPNIEFLDAIVNGHRQRKAEGWAPRIDTGSEGADAEPEARTDESAAPRAVAVCGLASNPAVKSKTVTKYAFTIRYYNVLGWTIIEKKMGEQQFGLRCDANCYPLAVGHSYPSSAAVFYGAPYSVDCGNLAVYGSSGRTLKFQAETKCAHQLSFGARADAYYSGAGVGVTIVWDQQGSIDFNGGQWIDSCGYF